jgi:zinc transporter ZupT
MIENIAYAGLAAASFAVVHVLGKSMRFLEATPRSIWLSFAGGVSFAYVFVHLLPERAASQRETLAHLGRSREGAIGVHLYVAALTGVLVFYGLERLVRSSRGGKGASEGSPSAVFWLHLGSYAIYNALVGYLLVHRQEADLGGLAVYAIALGLHFVVNDQGLREHHGALYDRKGRWILAAAPLLGWAAGVAVPVSPLALAGLFAFLAGGIVLNVLKEELPDDRESRFWALGLGSVGFAALLLAAR